MPDLLDQLAAPFPKECHKSRKIPGGSYYIYVPWERFVDRLNQLLGLNWSISYSDPAIAGDYVSVRAQLTIVTESGATIRDGIGTDRTFPQKNEDGKEKIIGDPLNNATRDALRDACYQFGMGRYLDNQSGVCKLLGTESAEQFFNQTRPKQPGEVSREEWTKSKKAGASTKPSPPEKQSRINDITKPLVVQRVNRAKKTFRLSNDNVNQLLTDHKLPSVYELSIEQCDLLIELMEMQASLNAGSPNSSAE